MSDLTEKALRLLFDAEQVAVPRNAEHKLMVEGAKAVSLIALAEAVEALVEVVKLMAPVSVTLESFTTEREVDLTPPPSEDLRPYHRREEIAAEVEALLPISAERLAQGMGITVHALYRALHRAGRDDLWRRLDREVLR